ncbi:hypothetical protein HNS38_14145 [Lentimicrobium sp. L6]|uniref:hypothetical protein n=1 Tax=Lentimicrobium sp. L6 TaxID=2735916 RepID=UPI0015519799|nr:hypothetical protein [Lentimicrobium sp. L6]NPD85911.1 hypothetical protein [Lentimicrobium sp. L6]
MKKKFHIILVLAMISMAQLSSGQAKLEFDGQLSLYGNYNPDSDLDVLLGGRYLPELNLKLPLKNSKAFDFQAAANIYGAYITHPFDSSWSDGNIKAYRAWGRYTTEQFELRVGLQKIDFGTAMLLRPLQWFDEIDPRDPLKFTNGVYGVLARYYFLNNANIWIWGLYGNENPRGFELMPSQEKIPEFGGRFQYPIPRGEIALSYHHRVAEFTSQASVITDEEIPENRLGLDGKWDVVVGLWFEAAYIQKTKDVGLLTHQTYTTLGTDYTFDLGNGLNVVVEHLVGALDEEAFEFSYVTNSTAAILSYPLTMYDNISIINSYSWDMKAYSFFLNYEHQFKNFTGYIMAYYNPDVQQITIENNFENTFTGPGIRLMVVYNH